MSIVVGACRSRTFGRWAVLDIWPWPRIAFQASRGAAVCFDPSSLSDCTLPRAPGSTIDVYGAAYLAKVASIGKQRVVDSERELAAAVQNAKVANRVTRCKRVRKCEC